MLSVVNIHNINKPSMIHGVKFYDFFSFTIQLEECRNNAFRCNVTISELKS